MAAITPIYTWTTAKGNLSLYQSQGPYLELTNKQGKTVNIAKEAIQNLPLDIQVDKISEVYNEYSPLIRKNPDSIFSVVFHKWGVPDGKQLYTPDDSELSETNKAFSGFSFTMNKLETKRAINFSKTAPFYRRVSQGLNLQGECSNQRCEAYDKVIYIPKGIGVFNIPREMDRSECPACDEKIDFKKASNLGFWNCQYTIDGKQIRPKVNDVYKKDSAPKEHFTTFQPGDNCEWSYLEVTTAVPI